MISSSNFVVRIMTRLVVLVRKDLGTTSPFSCLLDPVTLTGTLASFKKMNIGNIRKESPIGTCPTYLLLASRPGFKVSPNCVFVVFFI